MGIIPPAYTIEALYPPKNLCCGFDILLEAFLEDYGEKYPERETGATIIWEGKDHQ